MQRLTTTLGVMAVTGLVAATAAAQRGDDTGPADRCESTTCFNQRRIRDFEIIDKTTLIIFVGAQDCPFLVEFSGTFCDVTFLPGYDLIFRPSRQRRSRATPVVGGPGGANDTLGAIEQTNVCASDIGLGLPTEQVFARAGGGDIEEIDGLVCRIRDVRSITDDERLQIYVDRQMTAPPPPFGTGRVESPENPQEPEPAAEAEEDEGGNERRRRRRERNRDRE